MTVLTGSASAQTSPGSASIDRACAQAIERKDVPGVVALVTDRERVLYQGAFGVADVATGRPVAKELDVPHRLDDQADHLGRT